MRVKNYIRPRTVEEAYKIISEDGRAILLGGGSFLRLSFKKIDTIVDLQDVKLDFIEEKEDVVEIGAMVTLGELERSIVIKRLYDGYISKSVSVIWSVQLRNIATVGGTIFPKWGFSDFITALLALDVDVYFYKSGKMKLEDFLKSKIGKDILLKISIKKEERKASFQVMRNSFYDFSILNLSLSCKNGKDFRLAVGARPGVAMMAVKTMEFLNSVTNPLENLEKATEILSSEIEFGNDFRASGEYRKHLASVLFKRALKEVLNHES